MQGVVVFSLVFLVIAAVTFWVMRQPLRRNEALRQIAQAQAAEPRRDYTGVERRVQADRRRGERRRTEIDASLGHA